VDVTPIHARHAAEPGGETHRRHNRRVQVSRIPLGARISRPRGSLVVCITLDGARERFVGCLGSVLAHTASDVPILVCDGGVDGDGGSPDSRWLEFAGTLETPSSHELFFVPGERNLAPLASVNDALALAAPADAVLLSSECVVAEGWLEGLRRAAYVDSRVATSTALGSDDSVARVFGAPGEGRPPGEWRFDDAAATVRSRSLRLRPRLPAPARHCMYVRRSALELIGDFDLAFAPAEGDEARFSQRCVRAGLSHVLADDVLVHHRGTGGLAGDAQLWTRSRHGSFGPLTRSLSCARRALTGLSVVIDARTLSRTMTGTEIHVLEAIAALARTNEARLTVLVPDHLPGHAAEALTSLRGVVLVHHSEAFGLTRGGADIVHRPYQIIDPGDLAFLASLGKRLIVTNQDLISYHNPSYFKDFEAWNGYRRLTRLTLAVVDRVVFFSAYARDDAFAEDLVEPSRASVVHIGVDHAIAALREAPVPPPAARTLPEHAETVLCIGNDFRHKNRVFALRMLEQLRRRHDWAGYLLFAGPTVPRGSSSFDEAKLLARHPGLADSVIDFGVVSEAEKAWLLGRVGLVVYPTIHEGFGLVPFEAAQHSVPCMWAAGTSLRELLPDSAAEIEAWDAQRSADRALELLRDESSRERNLAAIRKAGRRLTWDATAARLLELYNAVCDAPATPPSALGGRHGVLDGTLSQDAMRLVGPGGALPADVERPLLALATHRQVGATIFGALKLGYRASFGLRRWCGRANGGRRS